MVIVVERGGKGEAMAAEMMTVCAAPSVAVAIVGGESVFGGVAAAAAATATASSDSNGEQQWNWRWLRRVSAA